MGVYIHRCNSKLKHLMQTHKLKPVNEISLTRQHAYAGHIARKVQHDEHAILRATIMDGELAWQNTFQMLNRGNMGHPKRFYAGQQWEIILHTFYWRRYETQWRQIALDKHRGMGSVEPVAEVGSGR